MRCRPMTFRSEAQVKPAMKTCTRCGEEKPATMLYFHKDSKSKDGLYASCRVCKNASMRRSQTKHSRR